MLRSKKHILSRFLCVLMALHIFNLSIDTPDAEPDYIAEDLKVNDIESVTELILEDVLQIDNAIPESDEPDDNDNGCPIEMKKIEFFSQQIEITPLVQTTNSLFTFIFVHKEVFYSSLFSEISTPPPRA